MGNIVKEFKDKVSKLRSNSSYDEYEFINGTIKLKIKQALDHLKNEARRTIATFYF